MNTQPEQVREIFLRREKEKLMEFFRGTMKIIKCAPSSYTIESICRAHLSVINHLLRKTEQGWRAWRQYREQDHEWMIEITVGVLKKNFQEHKKFKITMDDMHQIHDTNKMVDLFCEEAHHVLPSALDFVKAEIQLMLDISREEIDYNLKRRKPLREQWWRGSEAGLDAALKKLEKI
jgi:hypothetical protein